MVMTFRERTLEEEQAGSAKDGRGLALQSEAQLPAVGWPSALSFAQTHPTSLTAVATAFVDLMPRARNFSNVICFS